MAAASLDAAYATFGLDALWTPQVVGAMPAPIRLLAADVADDPLRLNGIGSRAVGRRRYRARAAEITAAAANIAVALSLTAPPKLQANDVLQAARGSEIERLKISGPPTREDSLGLEWTFDAALA